MFVVNLIIWYQEVNKSLTILIVSRLFVSTEIEWLYNSHNWEKATIYRSWWCELLNWHRNVLPLLLGSLSCLQGPPWRPLHTRELLLPRLPQGHCKVSSHHAGLQSCRFTVQDRTYPGVSFLIPSPKSALHPAHSPNHWRPVGLLELPTSYLLW